jgi:hypothetical protein
MELSIVLASRNETSMLCVTVLSAVEAIKESGVTAEIVVVENSDEDVHLAAMDCLAGQIKEGIVRVVRLENPSIAKAIHLAHEEGKGEYLFYTDAHTLIGHNTIPALLKFHKEHKDDPIGFVHAPIQWAHRSSATKRTHLSVSRTPLGEWAGATPVEKPSMVPWKGMPYMIRKSVWADIGGLGCCAEHNLGWGVLSYLGMKTWMLGYENWAIPDGVVYHFGEWPERVRPHAQYRTYTNSGEKPGLARAVALYVFGGEEALRKHFSNDRLERFFKNPESTLERVKQVAELERKEIAARQVRTFDSLYENPPWNMTPELISPKYRQLNQDLHLNPDVRFGYKGWEQAALAEELYRQHGCSSALDYGAGKQTFSKEMRSRGIEVADYDPSIPEISAMPQPADLVVCTDVLEHVEPEYFARVMDHLRSLTGKCLMVRVCLVPCTSKTLPDGSDPHRIVKDVGWWLEAFRRGFDVYAIHESTDTYLTVSLLPN